MIGSWTWAERVASAFGVPVAMVEQTPYDGPPVDENGDEPELVDEEWGDDDGK